jgi:hypothetical protein
MDIFGQEPFDYGYVELIAGGGEGEASPGEDRIIFIGYEFQFLLGKYIAQLGDPPGAGCGTICEKLVHSDRYQIISARTPVVGAITSRLARKPACKSGKCKAAAPEKDNEGQNDTIFKIPPFGLILLPEAVGPFYAEFVRVHIRLPIF